MAASGSDTTHADNFERRLPGNRPLLDWDRRTYAVPGPEGSRVKRRPKQGPDTPGEEPRLDTPADRKIEHTQSCREAGHRRRVGTPELDDRARITPSNRGAGRAGKPLALAMGSLTIAEGKFTHARTINNFFAAESPGFSRGEERRPTNDERSKHTRLTKRWPVQSNRRTYAVAGPEGSRVKRQPKQGPDTPGEEPRLDTPAGRKIEHTQSCREAGHRRRVGTPELDDRARITPSNRGAGRAGKPLALAMGSLTNTYRTASHEQQFLRRGIEDLGTLTSERTGGE